MSMSSVSEAHLATATTFFAGAAGLVILRFIQQAMRRSSGKTRLLGPSMLVLLLRSTTLVILPVLVGLYLAHLGPLEAPVAPRAMKDRWLDAPRVGASSLAVGVIGVVYGLKTFFVDGRRDGDGRRTKAGWRRFARPVAVALLVILNLLWTAGALARGLSGS